MSDGSGVETSEPTAVVGTKSLDEEKEKILSEFKNTFENMYSLIRKEPVLNDAKVSEL